MAIWTDNAGSCKDNDQICKLCAFRTLGNRRRSSIIFV